MCSSDKHVCTCNPNLASDWAIQEAMKRAGYTSLLKDIKKAPAIFKACHELARMIETYEKPPVDPLLLKAREIYKAEYGKQYPDYSDYIECIHKGKWDAGAGIQAVLTALRSCQ